MEHITFLTYRSRYFEKTHNSVLTKTRTVWFFFYKFTINILRESYLYKGVHRNIQWLKADSSAQYDQKQPPSVFCNTLASLLMSMAASDTVSERYVINSKADFHIDIILYISQLLYSSIILWFVLAEWFLRIMLYSNLTSLLLEKIWFSSSMD